MMRTRSPSTRSATQGPTGTPSSVAPGGSVTRSPARSGVRITAGGEGVTRKAVRGQPVDYAEAVEVLGEHVDSDGGGDDDDDVAAQLAASRMMNPYGR